MNIYFHIDELNRDAVVASGLKVVFRQGGHTLVYGNRVTNRLLKFLHGAFDVVVVPRPHVLYDNWGTDWMSWNTRFVMLSAESLGIICKDHQVMARTLLEKDFFEGNKDIVNRIDAFCLWGSKQLQAVKEFAGEVAGKCHVVGHPRHDVNCVGTHRNEEGSSRGTRKTIGIVTRAVGLNDYFGRSALDGFTTLFNDHFQYEFVNKATGERLPSKRSGAKPADTLIVQAIDVGSTLRVIRALETAGYDISVRVHPKENVEVWASLLTRCNLAAVVSDPRQPITRWLRNVDYLIGPPSTSFYDAVMLGVTPISICGLDPRRRESIGELWEDNNRLMPFVFKPKSVEELVDYVRAGNRNFCSAEILSVLKEEADFPDCRESLRKVVSVCTQGNHDARSRTLQLAVFRLVRYLFFIIWRLKNRVRGRRENSAMFAMGRREARFIDSLWPTR